MEKQTLHIIPHSHWDREWYMGFEQHHMRLVELFDTLITVMENNPDFTYYHLDGQYIVIEDYLQIRPHMRDRLVALIQADRIQIGPWYVLQDEFLTSGEANVRNMLYGIRLCRELGAEPVMAGYFPDAFGNISQVPQILRGFGMDSAVFGRGMSEVGYNNSIGTKENPSEWRWASPDGSEVVGIMFAHWYHNAMELPADKEALEPTIKQLVASTASTANSPHLLGLNGCDHQPVQTDLPAVIRTANQILAEQNVTVKQSGFKEYIEAVKPYAHRFPRIEGELCAQNTNGYCTLVNTASTHIPLKQQNHHCQNLLTQQAEPVSVLAARAGDTYREDMLFYTWKKLMENHPHDSICCCSCDDVADAMTARFAQVDQAGRYVRDEAMDFLRHRVAAPAEKSVLLCHTTAGTTTATVTAYVDYPEDAVLTAVHLVAPDGQALPVTLEDLGRQFTYTLPKDRFRQPRFVHRYALTFTVTMTGIGYGVYAVKEQAVPAPAPVTLTPRGAETDTLAVTIAPNGTLTVTDKTTGITYSDLNRFEDTADAGESYNYKPLPGDCPITTLEDEATVTVYSRCDNRVTLAVENHWSLPLGRQGETRSTHTVDTTVTSYITLTAGIHRVDIRTVFDNQSEDHRVRALFTPGITTTTVLADGQFDLVERSIQPGPAWENPSNCQRQQAFFALEDKEKGLAIAGRGLHEYEILQDGNNTMALTLLRSVGYMGDWGVFPTPKMQCKGEHTLEYAIVPYAAEKRAEAFAVARGFAADDFVVADVNAQTGTLPASHTLVSVDNPAVVTSACKNSEDGKATVLRLYNPLAVEAPVTLRLDAAVTAVTTANLAEEAGEALPIRDGVVSLTIPAKKIVTYRLT